MRQLLAFAHLMSRHRLCDHPVGGYSCSYAQTEDLARRQSRLSSRGESAAPAHQPPRLAATVAATATDDSVPAADRRGNSELEKADPRCLRTRVRLTYC
jgi:hypothetical protein